MIPLIYPDLARWAAPALRRRHGRCFRARRRQRL